MGCWLLSAWCCVLHGKAEQLKELHNTRFSSHFRSVAHTLALYNDYTAIFDAGPGQGLLD
jgi:hypothetical protein